ncbi:mitochondrial ribosomal protein L23 [Arctopsyche grandis]|uniref:mitochondrial ribosomal protein L23 n=1 Tax=Arctopsyche grandis TaxID=121162 RepID=UPI00406D8039
MSNRWYPLYQLGNPQLRVFLPNFWMKLVNRKDYKYPPNVVHFICSMKMTEYDVKNYLEKIYDIPVVEVHNKVVGGRTKPAIGKGYIVKDNDYKLARVTLPKTVTFEFPDVYPTSKEEEEGEKAMDEAKAGFKTFTSRNNLRPGVPGWFSF